MSLEKQNSQRCIYLADDDADDREILAEALIAVDPSIILKQAENGIELMEILADIKDHFPEILFLDINMPGKGGFECLEEIRREEGLKEIIIIILSTSSDPEDIERALELGASFYAVKPYSFEVLKSFVKEVLQIDFKMTQNNRAFRLI